MVRLIKVLRVTVIGGAMFLAPFIVLTIILGKAHQMTTKVISPIAEVLPFQSMIGLETPKFLAIFVLILVCFLAGMFARTNLAKKLVSWLENVLLSNLPGYSFMKHMGEEFAGSDVSHGYETVLVRFDESWQVGFLVERFEDSRVVVFLPGAPSPWSGDVVIVEASRVQPLQVHASKAVKSFQRLGEGTEALLGDYSKMKLSRETK